MELVEPQSGDVEMDIGEMDVDEMDVDVDVDILYPLDNNKYIVPHFQVENPIGQGAFGNVYSYTINSTPPEKIAIKLGSSTENKSELENWIQITSKCNAARHTVPLLGAWERKSERFYSMPQCYSTLKDVIDSKIIDKNILSVIPNIADALSCIHSAGLQHRDIHPGNIIYCPTHGWTLIDYGLSAPLNYPPYDLDVIQFRELIKRIMPYLYIYLTPDDIEKLKILIARMESREKPTFEEITKLTLTFALKSES